MIPVPVPSNKYQKPQLNLLAWYSKRDAPFLGLNFRRCRSSTAGIRNAKVFPEPVRAAPNTSFPASNGGIDLACTGVIVVNPISARAFCVGSESSSVENGSLPGALA